MGPWPSHRGGQPPPGQGERGPRGVKASRPPLCTVTGGEGATRWRPAASRPSPQPPRRAAVAAAGNGPGGHRGFLWFFFPLFFFFGFFSPLNLFQRQSGELCSSLWVREEGGCAALRCPHIPTGRLRTAAGAPLPHTNPRGGAVAKQKPSEGFRRLVDFGIMVSHRFADS